MVYKLDGTQGNSGTAPADADLVPFFDASASGTDPTDKIADMNMAQLAAYVATKIGVGGSNNMDATIDPTASDDTGSGYEVGSMWYNQTSNALFVAEDVTAAAAVWTNVSATVTEKALEDLWQAAATPILATGDKFPFADVSGTDTIGTATAPDICSTGGALLKDGTTDLTGDLVINERADHADTPTAGKGQVWVRSDTPNVLVFTDDAGTDTVLGSGSVTEKAIEDIIEGLTPAAPAATDEIVWRDVSGTDALGCSTPQQIVETAHTAMGITPQNRITTTTDPGANDDGAGTNGTVHIVNDLWTNTTTDTSWICQDITTTAAVWAQIDLTGGGDAWGDVVDADIIPDADGTRDLGADATRFALAYADDVHVTAGILVTEAADHSNTPAATKGEFWVRNDAPNEPMFTDDAGTDWRLHKPDVVLSGFVDLTNTTSTNTVALVMTAPVAGTITDIRFHSPTKTIPADGSNYWEIMPQNFTNSSVDLLAAAFSTASTTITFKESFDMGALHGTDANLVVAKGDTFQIVFTATGTPTTFGSKPIELQLTIQPT